MKNHNQPKDKNGGSSQETPAEKKTWRRPSIKVLDLKNKTEHGGGFGGDGGTTGTSAS